MIADIFVVNISNISGVVSLIVRDCDLYDFDKKI